MTWFTYKDIIRKFCRTFMSSEFVCYPWCYMRAFKASGAPLGPFHFMSKYHFCSQTFISTAWGFAIITFLNFVFILALKAQRRYIIFYPQCSLLHARLLFPSPISNFNHWGSRENLLERGVTSTGDILLAKSRAEKAKNYDTSELGKNEGVNTWIRASKRAECVSKLGWRSPLPNVISFITSFQTIHKISLLKFCAFGQRKEFTFNNYKKS